MLIASMTLSISANAWFNIDVTDTTILSDIDTVRTEVNEWVHKDRAMKFAFRKLSRIDKILKHERGQIPHIATVEDSDILDVLDSLTDEITNNDHRRIKLFFTRKKLAVVFYTLKRKRLEEQTPDLTPAMLNLGGTTAVDLGSVSFGQTSTATISVSNTGQQDATGITVTALTTAGFSIAPATTCGTSMTSLSEGMSCDLIIEYSNSTPFPIGPVSQIVEIQFFNGEVNSTATREFVAVDN